METLLLWPEGAPGALGTSDEDCPAITPYLVEGSNNAAVLICPGGAYWLRADHEGGPVAEWLNTLGISAFVLRYRVAPYQYPSALQDAQRALRTIRFRSGEYGVDPERVGILGFSAGGHLASTASGLFDRGNKEAEEPLERQSCRPDFTILCYPVISMTDGVTHEGSRTNLLGDNPSEELIRRLSGELQVTPDTPPAFLWHTADDGAVPVENSLLLASALRRQQIPFDLHVYAHGAHGLGLAEEEPHTRGWTDACASWLGMNGYTK
ncbi:MULTISPECIES: alpha/beta hydrolase [unclassified Paenibacillus]|uniref:alpha/beta hydrolase n=1 Tax=unclassified Paenibacillus TaxID=185978 RepID=UPI0024073A75|nr:MULTISPECIES: alpha/beta hydrolase [unclassified Paenibacillus]MDF9840531.1 acetyl esterase/lipase [Paenibacillus sp. PastF-2]MDF9847113.1 acetyl esterase/lipase [Paenibacillus sp. PastM-2]MDF9853685.1 acetyl esterase/lipase [Paenibacillus sp. PastF-1]MDH6478829.1 acetyl esterase/lipase [Paenibacillus sp. PastH-2]MDH6506561.1 acetyl esterase/lipase [Paenibacillus sp. PastM-3]